MNFKQKLTLSHHHAGVPGQWGGQEQQAGGLFCSPTLFVHMSPWFLPAWQAATQQPSHCLLLPACGIPHSHDVTKSCPQPVPCRGRQCQAGFLTLCLKCCHPQNVAGPDARGSQSCHLWVMAEQPRHFGCPLILSACTQSRAEGEQADGMQSCLRQTCTLLPSPRISAGTIKN